LLPAAERLQKGKKRRPTIVAIFDGLPSFSSGGDIGDVLST
jgi:hypothetical protein